MSPKTHALELLTFAHGMLTQVIDAVPADKVVYQTHPTANHTLWTLGHLVMTYNWLSATIDPSSTTIPKLPESYGGLFGMGSTPAPEASKYPSFAELRAQYDAAYNAYVGLLKALPESQLWSECAVSTNGFCTSKLDGAYKLAWHDGWHIGQVADIRRALGLKPLMGG